MFFLSQRRHNSTIPTILNKYDDTGTTELVELVNLVRKVFENGLSEWFLCALEVLQ